MWQKWQYYLMIREFNPVSTDMQLLIHKTCYIGKRCLIDVLSFDSWWKRLSYRQHYGTTCTYTPTGSSTVLHRTLSEFGLTYGIRWERLTPRRNELFDELTLFEVITHGINLWLRSLSLFRIDPLSPSIDRETVSKPAVVALHLNFQLLSLERSP